MMTNNRKKVRFGMFACVALALFIPAFAQAQSGLAQSGFRLQKSAPAPRITYQEMLGPWHIQCQKLDFAFDDQASCSATFKEIKRVSGYLDPVFDFEFRIVPELQQDGRLVHHVHFKTTPTPTWSEGTLEIGDWVLSLRKECKSESCHLSQKNGKQVLERMRKGASKCRMTFRNDNGRRQMDIPIYNFATVMERLEQHMK